MEAFRHWLDPRFLADLVVVAHFLFVVFAVFGALIALRWPRCAWLHLPVLVWAVLVEWTGWLCPLTPLEQWLRASEGAAAYSGGFIEHYLAAILYPSGLTRSVQIFLGSLLLAFNLCMYALVYRRARGRRKSSAA